MKSSVSKILNGLLVSLLGISLLLTLIFYFKNSGIAMDAPLNTQIELLGGALEYFFIWTYILIFVATAAALIFPLISAVMNPKGAIQGVIFLAIGAAIILISYAMADGTPLTLADPSLDNSPEANIFADTVIYTMYIFIVIAFGAWFYSGIAKLFK